LASTPAFAEDWQQIDHGVHDAQVSRVMMDFHSVKVHDELGKTFVSARVRFFGNGSDGKTITASVEAKSCQDGKGALMLSRTLHKQSDWWDANEKPETFGDSIGKRLCAAYSGTQASKP
jgi:hypothetical protein